MGCMNRGLCVRVFIGLVLIFTATFCVGLTDPGDVTAMNSLYIALGYPPLLGWLLVGGDPCGDKWQGVDCVFSNITALQLSGLNLGGDLGNSLEHLGSILLIDVSNNHIGGNIPGNLPNTIRNFSLSANQFTGSIPDALSSLSQLMDLSLNNNLLSGGIPDAFEQLTGLMHLDLSGNNLTGQLPPSLGNLTSLITLHLQNNHLSGTLGVLQDLPLQDLNIENNLFSGPIPENLRSIPNFRENGNPFNTSVIPSPPASAPHLAPSPAPGPYYEEAPRKPANGPFAPEMSKSAGTENVLTRKRVTLIAAIGALVLVALGLCLFMLRCLKRRREKKNAERHDIGLYNSGENRKYSEYSLQQNDRMEKVPRETVVRPLDRYAVGNGRTGVMPKLQDEQEIGVKTTAVDSMRKKGHEIGMDMDFLPPPPPPPFPVEKVIVKPIGPAEVATSRHPSKGLNTSSVKVFTVALLQQYTNSFSQEHFIGEGMLGSVYWAELPDGKVLAIKKLNPKVSREQSDKEFLELVSSISELRHANVVELVGYCAEHGQRLLVYEYCRFGTLNDALHMDDEIHKKLSWNARIQVALGAARALEYLHEVCQPPIIHRNFKSANLLLDDKFLVLVSDCGLAPLLSSGSASQVSGRLLTAYGYGAPEFDSGSYTYQSDVYSFGVIMLELLTGRKSYDRSRPRGEQFLVRWAIPQLHDIDALSRMVDPSLNGAFPIKSLSRFADVISSCVQREPEFRPPMSEIVQELLQMT